MSHVGTAPQGGRTAPQSANVRERSRAQRRRLGARWLGELACLLLVGLASPALAVLALRISPHDLTQRWTAGGDDQILHYMVTTSAVNGSLYGGNDLLGFPTSQDLFFAPIFDLGSALELKLLAPMVPDGIVLLNLFYVIGFALAGMAGYVCLRTWDVRRTLAVIFALVFALAPYHFQRIGMGHGFVANYWSTAFIGVALAVVSGIDGPWSRWAARAATVRSARWRRLTTVAVATIPVATGLNYYYVFAILVLGGVLVVRLVANVLAGKRLRGILWPALTVGALIFMVGVELVVMSLNLGDRYEHYFAARGLLESELYGGKITTLLLPWSGTSVPILGPFSRDYLHESAFLVSSEPPGTPIIAAVAMLAMALFLLVRGLADHLPTWIEDPRLGALSVAFLWSLFFFLAGGLSAILAAAVSGDIRAWSRLSIIMILFALLFAAVLAQRLTRGRRSATAGVVLALLAVLVVDQLTGAHSTVALGVTADRPLQRFVTAVEQHNAADCGVVELPLKSFPESGKIMNLSDYDLALPYLYSAHALRWSYGAVRGTRDGDYWQSIQTPEQFKVAYLRSKACAIVVDTAGYAPGGWRPWVAAVTDTRADARSHGDSGRYLLFDGR